MASRDELVEALREISGVRGLEGLIEREVLSLSDLELVFSKLPGGNTKTMLEYCFGLNGKAKKTMPELEEFCEIKRTAIKKHIAKAIRWAKSALRSYDHNRNPCPYDEVPKNPKIARILDELNLRSLFGATTVAANRAWEVIRHGVPGNPYVLDCDQFCQQTEAAFIESCRRSLAKAPGQSVIGEIKDVLALFGGHFGEVPAD